MEESLRDAGAGWSVTLAAALIGAERAPTQPLPAAMAGLAATGDPGGALLDRLGAFGTYNLAGTGLGHDALEPIAPFIPLGPVVPPQAAARFVTLLGSGGSQTGMIREWCEVAAERGFRLPPELVPLIESAQGIAQTKAAQAIAGAEIAWLRLACGEVEAEPAATANPAPQPEDEEAESAEPALDIASDGDWTEGTPTQRRAAFAGFRQRAPEEARAALEAAFKSEKADIREQLVSALETGLSGADEPFLEACLDDRAGGVRRAAQRLLSGLSGSRFQERMARRVGEALRIEETRKLLIAKVHTLVVTLPEEAPDLVRDGIEPSQYDWKKRGRKAQLLVQILNHAPFAAFGAHPPRVWIEQALKSDWAEPILDGLIAALWRERDPTWRTALIATLREAHSGKLSAVKPTNEIRDALAKAMAVLPAAEWEAAVAPMLKSPGLDLVLATMGHGPNAYTPNFTAAVFDWLALRTRGGPESTLPLRRSNVLSRLGFRADPSMSAEAAAAAIVSRLPDDADTYLRHQLTRMADTLSLRATIRREFATT